MNEDKLIYLMDQLLNTPIPISRHVKSDENTHNPREIVVILISTPVCEVDWLEWSKS